MEQTVRHNLDLSGVGSASGGLYKNVRVQGVGKVHGDIDCLSCDIEGVAEMFGNVHAEKVNISGKARVHGGIVAEKIVLQGKMQVGGSCEAETFHCDGNFQSDGLLNADNIRIRLIWLNSSIKEIGCETLRVEPKYGLLKRTRRLVVETIEGDDIYLENTIAKIVRGNKVTLGPGTRVDLVEYRTEFKKVGNPKVGQVKQL